MFEKIILKEIIENSDFPDERLGATISMGLIGNPESIPLLKKLLDDEEPNIRWDTALALAKLNDKSGYDILKNLLSREYYQNFSSVNDHGVTSAILIVLRVLNDAGISSDFKEEIIFLSKSEENIKIRDFAMQIVADY